MLAYIYIFFLLINNDNHKPISQLKKQNISILYCCFGLKVPSLSPPLSTPFRERHDLGFVCNTSLFCSIVL
jgi:hypothetical protein